jgi:hypothetical protein
VGGGLVVDSADGGGGWWWWWLVAHVVVARVVVVVARARGRQKNRRTPPCICYICDLPIDTYLLSYFLCDFFLSAFLAFLGIYKFPVRRVQKPKAPCKCFCNTSMAETFYKKINKISISMSVFHGPRPFVLLRF